jgi:hypothetical protein
MKPLKTVIIKGLAKSSAFQGCSIFEENMKSFTLTWYLYINLDKCIDSKVQINV